MLSNRQCDKVDAAIALLSGSLELGISNAFQRRRIVERLQELIVKGNTEFDKHAVANVCADPTCEKPEHVHWRLNNGVPVKIWPKRRAGCEA